MVKDYPTDYKKTYVSSNSIYNIEYPSLFLEKKIIENIFKTAGIDNCVIHSDKNLFAFDTNSLQFEHEL